MATNTQSQVGNLGKEESKKQLREAASFDKKFRETSRRINELVNDWFVMIVEARENQIHKLVEPAFPSWKAYITDVLEKECPMLRAAAREPIALMLRDEGLTIQTIADILKVSVGTAWADLNKDRAKPNTGNPQNHNRRPAEIAAEKITATTKTLAENADKMTVKERGQLRKETLAQLDAVASPLEQLTDVLTDVRAVAKDERKVPTKDLERIQIQLRAALTDVEEQLVARKAGKPATRTRKARGTNARTGQAA
jgi:predicted transcriptional regulator